MNPINRLQIRSVEALRAVARAATISAIEQYRLAQAANASVSGIQVRSKDRRLVLWCDLAAYAEEEAEDRLKHAILAWQPGFCREDTLRRRHPQVGVVHGGTAYLVLFKPSARDLDYGFGEYDMERPQTRVMVLKVVPAAEVPALDGDEIRIIDLEWVSN